MLIDRYASYHLRCINAKRGKGQRLYSDLVDEGRGEGTGAKMKKR